MSFNPHSDPIAREVHDARMELQGVRDELRELNAPPEVRAALHARRREHERARRWALRLVAAIVLSWVLLNLLFGRTGNAWFGALLSVAGHAINLLLVGGALVGVVGLGLRVVRWLWGPASGRVRGAD